MAESTSVRCDIFCAVVDNLGDAGVCWRLAQELATEQGWRVRLWIDDPAPLERLARGHAQGPVEVRHWPAIWPSAEPAEVVIEALACDLPEAYVVAMAEADRKPVWINLEYLSAEAWVAGNHGLPSPHPRLPLLKHFFFPGFDPSTGGLLRERDYDRRRVAFDEDAFRREFDLAPRRPGELAISLFAYPHAPLDSLLDALASHPDPVLLLLPGREQVPADRGSLQVRALPFLPQARFDEILWAADLNFVRGEDSFVRAQWAGKPMVWQIYPQEEGAHLVKLDAFLARHPAGTEMRDFWLAWNGVGTLDWPDFSTALPTMAFACATWGESLRKLPELAASLAEFCGKRLK